jgi:hypothetical protein
MRAKTLIKEGNCGHVQRVKLSGSVCVAGIAPLSTVFENWHAFRARRGEGDSRARMSTFLDVSTLAQ